MIRLLPWVEPDASTVQPWMASRKWPRSAQLCHLAGPGFLDGHSAGPSFWDGYGEHCVSHCPAVGCGQSTGVRRLSSQLTLLKFLSMRQVWVRAHVLSLSLFLSMHVLG